MEESNNDLQWERKDLHWRDERCQAEDRQYQIRGYLLLLLIAGVLLLNGLLVGCIQRMTRFPYPEASAVLEEFPGYDLLDSKAQEGAASFLIASADAAPVLVTAEKHSLFDRWQLVCEDQVSAPKTIVRGDCWSVTVSTQDSSIGAYQVKGIGLDTNMPGLPEQIPVRVLILSLGMTALEMGLWYLLRKLRKL